MTAMRWLGLMGFCVAVATVVVLAEGEQAAPKPDAQAAAPAVDLATVQKQLVDGQQALAAQLRDIQHSLDSISKFLGDRQASTFDSVDRRLRDLERNMDDLDRKVDRLR